MQGTVRVFLKSELWSSAQFLLGCAVPIWMLAAPSSSACRTVAFLPSQPYAVQPNASTEPSSPPFPSPSRTQQSGHESVPLLAVHSITHRSSGCGIREERMQGSALIPLLPAAARSVFPRTDSIPLPPTQRDCSLGHRLSPTPVLIWPPLSCFFCVAFCLSFFPSRTSCAMKAVGQFYPQTCFLSSVDLQGPGHCLGPTSAPLGEKGT